jgi:hypothetical protein
MLYIAFLRRYNMISDYPTISDTDWLLETHKNFKHIF